MIFSISSCTTLLWWSLYIFSAAGFAPSNEYGAGQTRPENRTVLTKHDGAAGNAVSQSLSSTLDAPSSATLKEHPPELEGAMAPSDPRGLFTEPAYLGWKENGSDEVLVSPMIDDSMEAAAVRTKTFFWPPGLDGKYEVPIYTDAASPITKQRLDWVFGYIMRATNIVFRPNKTTDRVHAVVEEKEDVICNSAVGQGAGISKVSMNLHPDQCTTIHMVLHEVLHLLGFHHEHERPEVQTYFPSASPGGKWVVGNSTPFDSLSVMMYPEVTVGKHIDPQWREAAGGRRSFMTTCDWNLLLTIYPGRYEPPACVPNKIANVLLPTLDGLAHWNGNLTKALWMCHYQNEFHFDDKRCVVPRGKKYPSIDVEFFRDSSQTRNVRNKRDSQSSELHDFVDDPDAATNTKHERKTQRLRENTVLSHFCSAIHSRDLTAMSNEECFAACMYGCKKYVPHKTPAECLREDYSVCGRWNPALSGALPSFGLSFAYLLLALSTFTVTLFN